MNEESLYLESVELLKELISTQSFSFHEENTATLLENWLNKKSIPFKRHVNNIYCYNKYYNEEELELKICMRIAFNNNSPF